MVTLEKTFAIIEDGIVVNAIVAEAMVIAQALLPDAQLLEVTEDTGSAFIGGTVVDGKFVAPKPFESWTLDPDTKVWVAPTPMPEVEPGFVYRWNEQELEWDSEQVQFATESE